MILADSIDTESNQRERQRKRDFRKDFESLLNRYSMENGSNTPDFLLAEYLCDCMAAWDKVVMAREEWYGRRAQAGSPGFLDVPITPPTELHE